MIRLKTGGKVLEIFGTEMIDGNGNEIVSIVADIRGDGLTTKMDISFTELVADGGIEEIRKMIRNEK